MKHERRTTNLRGAVSRAGGAMILLSLAACGATPQGSEAGELGTNVPEGSTEISQARLVVHADLEGGQELDIFAVPEVDEESSTAAPETSYFMRYHGKQGVADPMQTLRDSNPMPLTMAEVYVGLTGKLAPDELLDRHAFQAEQLERTTDFITPAFDASLASVEKGICGNPNANLTPPIPGHKYTENSNSTVFFCPGDAASGNCPTLTGVTVTKYVCSGLVGNNLVPGRGMPGANSCPKKKGWIHNGFCPNPGTTNGPTFLAQQWFGPSTAGTWTANPAFNVYVNDFYTGDWDGKTARAMSTVFSRTQSAQFVARTVAAIVVPN